MARADRAGEKLRLPRPAVPTPADLAGSEARRRGRQAYVGCARLLEPSGDGIPVDGDDHRLAHPPDGMRVVGPSIEPVAVLPIGAVPVEVGDVAAGAEGPLTGTREQHRVDRIIVVDLVRDRVHLAVHGHRHRVEFRRPIDRHDADGAAPFEPDLSVCGAHTTSSLDERGTEAAPTAPLAINWLTRLAS